MDSGSFEVPSSRYKALDAEIFPCRVPDGGVDKLLRNCRHDGDTIRIVNRRPNQVRR